MSVLGSDLALTSVIGAMLRSEEAWRAMNIFAAEIMKRKEEEERQRELDRVLSLMADESAPPTASPNRDGSPAMVADEGERQPFKGCG